MTLSAAQWRLLGDGFRGPRPGSKALALLGLSDGAVTVTGEEIDRLLAAGLLTVRRFAGRWRFCPQVAGLTGKFRRSR